MARLASARTNLALDRRLLVARAGHLDGAHVEAPFEGLNIVLGRPS
jgi:hypothetical protein